MADVYLPQEDGRLIFDLIKARIPIECAKQQIFENDVAAILACHALLIILDGRTVDEGACFELGYAYCLGKVCIGLKTDVRSLLPFGDNPMVEGALQKIFHDEEALINWIRTLSQSDFVQPRELAMLR
jgi:nucleoside 2-deoxyribosyltransferase